MRRSAAFILASLALAGWMRAANPQMPAIPATICNVTNYGALGDGLKDNTTNIQNTINAASAAGGGIVEIPAGTFLSGPLTLKSKINLQIDSGAMLQMLPYTSWPGTTAFINGSGLQDVEISGSGTVDGQGAAWWAAYNSSGISRPNFISFSGCTRLLIQNVTLQNPPTFHLMLKGNNVDLTIQGITINTPASPNTDGMDLASTNVLIQNCYISDGDDNIEIGGSDGPAAFITVTNCTFGIGHGVSIGSITSGGVSNLMVINCTFSGTDYGIRMKSDNVSSGGGSGGICQNLSYYNLGMTNVKYGMAIIYSYYKEVGTPTSITPVTAAGETVDPVTARTVVWRNITISNVTATVSSSGVAGIIWGRTELPATNIVMSHVNITASKTFDVYNAQGIQFLDSKINTGSGKTFTIWNANVTVSNTAPAANFVTFDGMGGNTNDSLALYNVRAAMTSTNAFGANPITLGGCVLTNTGNLAFSNNEVINFALGTNNSIIVVTGNLNLRGTLNLTNAAGFAATNYILFTYTGSLTNSPVLGAKPVLNSYVYRLDTNTAGQVKLVVVQPSPPDFGTIQFANGGGLVLTGTGGATNGLYYVLTSTNLALPLNQWTPVATNPFDGNGNFAFTNTPAGSSASRFYRLQLP